jgi:membrane-associated protein
MPHHFFLYKLSYLGMFLLLAGAGIFSPIPEEITLLTSGYLSANGLMDPWIAIPLGLLGAIMGDVTLFFLAKTGASYAKKMRDKLKRLRLERTWVFTPESPLRAVFFMRFITGLRMISPVYAAIHEVTWVRFLATSFSALVIFVPLLFSIGYFFNKYLGHFVRGFEFFRHAIFGFFLILVILGMIAALYYLTPHAKRRREERRDRPA